MLEPKQILEQLFRLYEVKEKKQLAAILGIPPGKLSAWDKGKYGISLKYAKIIRDKSGIDIFQSETRQGEEKPDKAVIEDPLDPHPIVQALVRCIRNERQLRGVPPAHREAIETRISILEASIRRQFFDLTKAIEEARNKNEPIDIEEWRKKWAV